MFNDIEEYIQYFIIINMFIFNYLYYYVFNKYVYHLILVKKKKLYIYMDNK